MKNRQGQFLTWTRPENKVYDGNDGLITSRKRISLSYYLIIELNSRTDTSSKKFMFELNKEPDKKSFLTKYLFNEELDTRGVAFPDGGQQGGDAVLVR